MLSMHRARVSIFCFLAVSFIFLSSDICLAANFSVAGVRINKKVRSMKEIRQQNVVTQSLDFSCGPAGLSTLLNYYLKDPISEKQIVSELLQTTPLAKVKERKGFSLYDLKQYAERKGYKVTGYQMDFDFLKKLHKPVLVPIKFKNYRHFVVVKEVIGDRVFIADPAIGNMTMKDVKFKALWTNGIGFLVEHQNEEDLGSYPLQVAKEDVRLSEYQMFQNLMDPGRIRTTIFPNEWR